MEAMDIQGWEIWKMEWISWKQLLMGLKGQVKELRTEKADAKDVNELKKNVVDLVNRSKCHSSRRTGGV